MSSLLAIPMAGWADPSLECSVTANSQVEIGACVGDMLTGAEQAMEIALGFAKSSAAELDEITQRDMTLPALEAAQAAWVGYRDAHCDHIGATYGGGSGTGIAINSSILSDWHDANQEKPNTIPPPAAREDFKKVLLPTDVFKIDMYRDDI